jgi:hypothetical protein
MRFKRQLDPDPDPDQRRARIELSKNFLQCQNWQNKTILAQL